MLNFVWRRRQLIVLAILLLVVASPVLATEQIQWAESIETGFVEAKKTGKPIMMDFYTEW